MYCSKCGNEIKQGEKFCPNCGKAIKDNKNKEKKDITIKNIVSKNKKVIIMVCIILLAIILIVSVAKSKKQNTNEISTTQNKQSSSKELLTEKSSLSDNGMRFTFDIQQLEERFIKNLKEKSNQYQNLVDKNLIDTNFARYNAGMTYGYTFNQNYYSGANDLANCFMMTATQENYESNYINFISINSKILDDENNTEDNILYAFMAIDKSLNFDKAKDILTELSQLYKDKESYISNNGLTYTYTNESPEWRIIEVLPLDEEQYLNYKKELSEGLEDYYPTDSDEDTDDDLSPFNRDASWYDDAVSGKEMIMPNLTGMNYGEALGYLENNGYYFIENIKCKYSGRTSNNESGESNLFPLNIISTIPEPGATLSYDNDKEISALVDYAYFIRLINIESTKGIEQGNGKTKAGTDLETSWFGKKIKIQLGDDESRIIENTVGSGFFKSGTGDRITYSTKVSDYKDKIQLVNKKETSYYYENEIEYVNTNNSLKVKVWIDGQLIKDGTATASGGQLNIYVDV